jgi:hypothetical protein
VTTVNADHPAVEAARLTVELIADPAVGRRWSEESTLAGYRIGGLAAHLARAIETIPAYLEADAPGADAVLVDAPGYYAAVLGDHDPYDSEFHRAVRQRGESRVEAGHEALVSDVRSAAAWLRDHSLDLDRPVSVLAGTAMRCGSYLDTRLVEMVIHGHDLATSVGLETPEYGDEAWADAARVLSATTLARHGARALALALARPTHRSAGAFTTG